MIRWHTEIVESARILSGCPLDLTEACQRLEGAGYQVRFVLPNGVNRWTVIAAHDDAADAPAGPAAGG